MRSSVLPIAWSLLACAVLVGCSSPSSADPPADSGVGEAAPGDVAIDSAEVLDTAPRPDAAFASLLSATTLYSDFGSKTIAPDAIPFEPAYPLWSDGDKKRRWVQLPPGTKIDTSDMENWKFPIGTKFWKEFASPDGKVLFETRLIERQSENGYRFGSYVWRPDGSDAEYTEKGAVDINGTDHDVPTLGQCQACHSAAPGRINGFQALQLSKPAPGTNLDWLVAQKLLSDPPPSTAFAIPGDSVAQAALGYLHANCGHCHNPNWELFSTSNQVLRLTTGATRVEDTTTYKTTVWQKTTSFRAVPYRIVPGDSSQSAVTVRMGKRGDPAQMPPIGTKHVDDVGLAAVRAWIDSLPKTDPPGDAGVDGGPDAGDPDSAPDAAAD